MQEPKFSLIEASEEEKSSFMKKFGQLLEESSMYFEPVPQFTRESLQSPWKIVYQIFLQKKVEIKEEGVISPIQNEDVNPTETA